MSQNIDGSKNKSFPISIHNIPRRYNQIFKSNCHESMNHHHHIKFLDTWGCLLYPPPSKKKILKQRGALTKCGLLQSQLFSRKKELLECGFQKTQMQGQLHNYCKVKQMKHDFCEAIILPKMSLKEVDSDGLLV